MDAGVDDPKLVCADRAPTDREWAAILRFFQVYATAKTVLNRLRRQRGWTGVRGWSPR